MVRSMTGFGRASSDEGSDHCFLVEIKSVNHRYLDLNVRMPRGMISLEEKIRRVVSEKLSRGKVDVFINYKDYGKRDSMAKLNSDLADSYYKCLEELQGKFNVKNDITLSLIARFPDVIYQEEKEDDLELMWKELSFLMENSLDKLSAMRAVEGEKLKVDILNKCDIIKSNMSKIEEKSPKVVIDYKKKLEERIQELVEAASLDENRLSMEVAIFADKCCIDEEITRLNSHIEQTKATLELVEPIGRKLDFIVQEMNREANTIASKSQDLEITNLVLNIKNEIEKIREQVQNIE